MNSKKIILGVALAFFAVGAMQAQTFKYIGAPKCKMCHMKPAKGEDHTVVGSLIKAKKAKRKKVNNFAF